MLTTVSEPSAASTVAATATRGSSRTHVGATPPNHMGALTRRTGRRITSQALTGNRLSRAIPYAAASGCSSPVAASQVAPAWPLSAATKRCSRAPIARAATAVRSEWPDRGWWWSTSCRASTSASREAMARSYTPRSTSSSDGVRPLRMLKVATLIGGPYPLGQG